MVRRRQVSEARRARTQGRGGTRAHGRGSVGNWPRASAGNWVAKAAKLRLSGTHGEVEDEAKQKQRKESGVLCWSCEGISEDASRALYCTISRE